MANKPSSSRGLPVRSVRISNEIWNAAKSRAERESHMTMSWIVSAFVEGYAKGIIDVPRLVLVSDPTGDEAPARATPYSRAGQVPQSSVAEGFERVTDLPLTPGMANPPIFEFALYRGERLEAVTTTIDLVARVVEKLIAEGLDLGGHSGVGGMVEEERRPNVRYRPLDDGRFLYTGWAPQYQLDHLQTSLRRLSLENEVLVKMAAEGAVPTP